MPAADTQPRLLVRTAQALTRLKRWEAGVIPVPIVLAMTAPSWSVVKLLAAAMFDSEHPESHFLARDSLGMYSTFHYSAANSSFCRAA